MPTDLYIPQLFSKSTPFLKNGWPVCAIISAFKYMSIFQAISNLSCQFAKIAIRSVKYDPQLHKELKEYEKILDPEDYTGEAREYSKTKSFDIRYFKTLTDPYSAIEYANRRLEKIGVGSSRAVFVYNPKSVLKIAMNEAGMAQNLQEIEIATTNEFDDIIAKIFDYNRQGLWVISELAKPFAVLEFEDGGYYEDETSAERMFQEHSPVDFATFMEGAGPEFSQHIEELEPWQRTHESFEQFLEKAPKNISSETQRKTKMLREMVEAYGLVPVDVARRFQWGRTADGRIVLLDYGFSSDVFQSYYKNTGNLSKPYLEEQFPIDRKWNQELATR